MPHNEALHEDVCTGFLSSANNKVR